MSDSFKLAVVKTVHTLIWLFFNLVLAYMYYAAFTNQVDHWFWLGTGLIGLECIVLFLNNWMCPLSPIARRYTDSTADNFDIYVPNWVARNNKFIYSVLAGILIGVYLIRVN